MREAAKGTERREEIRKQPNGTTHLTREVNDGGKSLRGEEMKTTKTVGPRPIHEEWLFFLAGGLSWEKGEIRWLKAKNTNTLYVHDFRLRA